MLFPSDRLDDDKPAAATWAWQREDAGTQAGAEAREAFQAAFNSDPVAMPDLGLDDYATDARSQAEALREVMSGVVEAATAPMESVAALREAVAASGVEAETALTGARTAAEALETAIDDAGDAAGRAGGAGRGAGQALRERPQCLGGDRRGGARRARTFARDRPRFGAGHHRPHQGRAQIGRVHMGDIRRCRLAHRAESRELAD